MKPGSHALRNSGDTAFRVALWCIGAVAAVQLVAVVWKVVPATVVRVSTPQQAADAADPVVARTLQPTPDAANGGPPPEVMQKAMELVAEIDRLSRLGDWERAHSGLLQAMELLPGDQRLEFTYAFVLERLGRETEARQILERLLQRPDLYPETRAEAAKLQDWIEQTLANMAAQGIPIPEPGGTGQPRIRSEEAANLGGAPILEDMGLQPGATLGIIQAREIDAKEGIKTLRVAIKSRPDVPVDAADVKVIVRFFEREPDGSVVPTESQASSQWISPPVDWADNEPEILDVMVALPDPEDSMNVYHGYVVAIYHRDELQDTRAVPGGLDQIFPPELFLEPSEL